MKYLIFSSIVGLCIAYYLKLSHIRAIEAKADDAYWERERKASFTTGNIANASKEHYK